MDQKERQSLVATWIEHHKIGRETGKSPDATFWAWEKLDELVSNDPNQALELIIQILETDQSDVTYENLAAGPLEDLLARHGEKVIERIENQSRESPTFQNLLGGVWENRISPSIWTRVEKARGEHW